MPRNPYDAHLCAQDPVAFKRGFDRAADWITEHPDQASDIYYAIKYSDGGADWPILGYLSHTPEHEGLVLGVYGIEALKQTY